MVDP
jgi:hypothetical protein